MLTTTKREKLRELQANAETAKQRLIDILGDLEEGGYKRKAKVLAGIIERLEVWQNRP